MAEETGKFSDAMGGYGESAMQGLQGTLQLYSLWKQQMEAEAQRKYAEAIKRYTNKQREEANSNARKQALQAAVGAKTIFAPKEIEAAPSQADYMGKLYDPLGIGSFFMK